ncbi:hypothetical protein N0V88_004429 [Collariella sp. IMI 366227]|nr:hypothetical protein N0V88_004429 [Collariella sp. IMI 366227]
MTFVLALAIVAVFGAGLVKMWWNNRLMRRQEVLDEEKRARVEEMRRTGLPIKRANNIPFGVRAIQSGVEVDGIWISRPESLSDAPAAKPASSTTLTGRDSHSQNRGQDTSGDERSVMVATTTPGPRQSQSSAPISQRLTDSDSATTRLPSLFAHTTKRQPSQPAGALSEDTVHSLEGTTASQTPLRDVPTNHINPSKSAQPSRFLLRRVHQFPAKKHKPRVAVT